MRKFFVLALMACVPAMAAEVSVAVTVGDPRFFGRIEIDSFPQPRLIFPKPVVVQIIPVGVIRAPLYLRVPPGHCAEYNACGAPVYFIEDGWYNTVYAPEYKARHGHPDNPGKGHGNGKGNGKGKGQG